MSEKCPKSLRGFLCQRTGSILLCFCALSSVIKCVCVCVCVKHRLAIMHTVCVLLVFHLIDKHFLVLNYYLKVQFSVVEK